MSNIDLVKSFIEKNNKLSDEDIIRIYPKVNISLNPETEESTSSEFNRNRKSETFIQSALPGSVRCGI